MGYRVPVARYGEYGFDISAQPLYDYLLLFILRPLYHMETPSEATVHSRDNPIVLAIPEIIKEANQIRNPAAKLTKQTTPKR
jgi:hypothetical protein